MVRRELKNNRQRMVMDGGLVEIEHYGKPSQVTVKDKRNHVPFMDRLREELELLFSEIEEADDELKAIIDGFKRNVMVHKSKRLREYEKD